ncbi:MAG: hypothetical protein RIS64_2936 [Bacteroidota bacterium]|jgi:hypothetical protein
MRKITTLFFAITFLNIGQAQYSEVGLSVGVTNYIGDLQYGNMPETRAYGSSGGLMYRYNFSPRFSVSGHAALRRFSYTDAYANGSRRNRNLSFRNTLYEVGIHGEVNLTKYDVLDGKISAPYLILGVAGFYHNPEARDKTGKWIALQPLGTEGQTLNGGKPYRLFQISIPYGLGVKLAASKRVNFGLELVFHQTFTDYLDDVSGNYPDVKALKEQNEVAAQMSWRTPAFFGVTNLEAPTGQKRGDNYKTDIYYYISGTMTINLGSTKKMEYNSNYRTFLNL